MLKSHVALLRCASFGDFGYLPGRITALITVLYSLLELGHTVFISHSLFDLLITNWGNVASLTDIPWTLKATIMWSSLVGLCAQASSR